MTYGSLPGTYSGTAKLLHWLVALCVLTIAPVGVIMGRLQPGPTQDALYNFHKSLGVTILVLMLLRLIYRLAHGAPAPEPTIAGWQRAASSAVHGLLYVLLLIQPVVGYFANSAFGAATPVWGLFQLPPIVAQNQGLAEEMFHYHRLLGYVIAALVVIHIAAALQHYFLERDGVLQRMLPRALGGD